MFNKIQLTAQEKTSSETHGQIVGTRKSLNGWKNIWHEETVKNGEKSPWGQWARSIQPKFPEISVQNSMDRFGPTGKVSKKRVHLLRWTTFPGRTGWNFA